MLDLNFMFEFGECFEIFEFFEFNDFENILDHLSQFCYFF